MVLSAMLLAASSRGMMLLRVDVCDVDDHIYAYGDDVYGMMLIFVVRCRCVAR